MVQVLTSYYIIIQCSFSRESTIFLKQFHIVALFYLGTKHEKICQEQLEFFSVYIQSFQATRNRIFKVVPFFRQPESARNDPDFRKRYAWGMCFMPVVLFACWGYLFLGVIFQQSPPEYQWIVGLLSPLAKEIFVALFLYVSYKASGSRDIKIKLAANHFMETKHAIFLAVILASVATPTTGYCIIGIDFAINLFNGLKIVYALKYKKVPISDGKFQELDLLCHRSFS